MTTDVFLRLFEQFREHLVPPVGAEKEGTEYSCFRQSPPEEEEEEESFLDPVRRVLMRGREGRRT